MAHVQYNAADVRGLGPAVQLKPGLNEIPDEIWEPLWNGSTNAEGKKVPGFKDNPLIKPLIKSGLIQVLPGEELSAEEKLRREMEAAKAASKK